MKKLILTILSFALIQGTALSQQIQWQKCLGGNYFEGASSIQQTLDGGYIVAGGTFSFFGQVTCNHGSYDWWVVKLNSSGDTLWTKCLGGTGWDFVYSVQQTTDGGYILAGETNSNDGDVAGNHGSSDFWVVKLDSIGNITWQKCLGGTLNETARSIEQTSDGGYIIAGYTDSNDGDVSGNHSNHHDFWIVKLDTSGNITWQKCLGGIDHDRASSIQQALDGGYIVAGYTESNDGDVSGNHGDYDYWVVKLDSSGNITWQKCLGGTDEDWASSVLQTFAGGYIVAGFTQSNDGNVSGNHGSEDYWIVNLNGNGNIIWQKCLGGTNNNQASCVQQTSDGGYIVAGRTSSNNGDVTGNHSWAPDYWVVKLNSSGNLQWQKCLGGTDEDRASSIQQTTDGGYIVVGDTYSNDGDVSGNHGETDYWIVKLDSTTTTSVPDIQNNGINIQVYPNPTTGSLTFELEKTYTELTVTIKNVLGQDIQNDQFSSTDEFQLTINGSTGIYFVHITNSDGQVAVVKVLKE